MKLKLYQVDAFASRVFTGNPAAVCPLQEWLPDDLMQKIAMENNLAETAFFVREPEGYRIRWFTPTVEVDLCGHATLASGYVFFNYLEYKGNEITFNSRSGQLVVTRNGKLITLDFPADPLTSINTIEQFYGCFNENPVEAYRGKTDAMLIFENESQIKGLVPDFARIQQLDARGVIATAKGNQVDFVSRFFAPQSGIAEDPVTGSAHTTLTPYWAAKLGKTSLSAAQLSARLGELQCELAGDRVKISGNAHTYLIGEIHL